MKLSELIKIATAAKKENGGDVEVFIYATEVDETAFRPASHTANHMNRFVIMAQKVHCDFEEVI